MLKEIQTVRLSEERKGGHSREKALTRGTKRTCRSKKRNGRCEVRDNRERILSLPDYVQRRSCVYELV